MQIVRDAFALLLAVLVIATVRISPVPEIELSPAQASPAVDSVASSEAGAAPPSREQDSVVTVDEVDCRHAMAARSEDRPADAGIAAVGSPCDV